MSELSVLEEFTPVQIAVILVLCLVGVLLSLTLVLYALMQRRHQPRSALSSAHSSLVEAYGLSPAPSTCTCFTVAVVMFMFFWGYAMYSYATMQYNSSRITTRVSVEEFEELPFPAVRVCVVKSEAYSVNMTSAVVFFSQSGGTPLRYSDPPTFETSRFLCYESNTDGNLTVKRTDNRPSLEMQVQGALCNPARPAPRLGGVFIVTSLPNTTSSPDFNPETTVSGIFASLGFFTHLAISYTKTMPVVGDPVINITHRSSFMYYSDDVTADKWPCNGVNSSLILEFTLDSNNILTTAEVPMASITGLLTILVSALGTFYSIYTVAKDFLAKHCAALRTKSKKEALLHSQYEDDVLLE